MRFYVLPENVTIEDDRVRTITEIITEHLKNFKANEGNTTLEIEAKIGSQEFSPYMTQDQKNVLNNIRSLNQNWEVLFVPNNKRGVTMPYNFKSNLNSIIDGNPNWSPEVKTQLMRGTFDTLIEILHDISQNHNPNLKYLDHWSQIDEIHRNKMRASYKLDENTQ